MLTHYNYYDLSVSFLLRHYCLKFGSKFCVHVLAKPTKQYGSATITTQLLSLKLFLSICGVHCTVLGLSKFKWAGPWENVSYVICEQQRRRSACASAQSDQRLCCSLLRYYNISRFYSRNFKPLASFCSWAGQWVWPSRKLPKARFVMTRLKYFELVSSILLTKHCHE